MKSIRSLSLLTLSGMIVTACTSVPAEFESVSTFAQVDVDFDHHWHDSAHPFTTAAVIDIDGDGTQEVFVGGGEEADDVLLSYDGQRLVDVIEGTGLSGARATYASASIDVDDDGDTDLFIGRANGLFLYLNESGRFVPKRIDVELPADAVPLAIALSDIDHDGDADVYVSMFVDAEHFRSPVFNDPDHAKTNVLLLNEGDLSFRDITASSGTAGLQNTFLAVFSDLDNDGWQDLMLAQNTGEIELFRNNRDLTFSAIETGTGLGFWMGAAVGDIDNDGDQDMLFTNVGNSIPAAFSRGDIRDDQRQNIEWLLWRNDGDFRFTDVTEEYALHDEGFAWGAVFEDLNLDGRLDVLVAQSYVKWPVHWLFKLDSVTALQTRDGRFAHVPDLGLENAYYGQSPLIADLNADGRPDVMWVNMKGPLRAFINQSESDGVVLKVPEQARHFGTRVTLVTDRGRSYTKEVMTSTGFSTDHSPDLVFGLAAEEVPQHFEIVTRDGRSRNLVIGSGMREIILR